MSRALDRLATRTVDLTFDLAGTVLKETLKATFSVAKFALKATAKASWELSKWGYNKIQEKSAEKSRKLNSARSYIQEKDKTLSSSYIERESRYNTNQKENTKENTKQNSKEKSKYVFKIYENENERLVIYRERELVEKREKGLKIVGKHKEVSIDEYGGDSSKKYDSKEKFLEDVMDFVGNLKTDKKIKMNDMDQFKQNKVKSMDREL